MKNITESFSLKLTYFFEKIEYFNVFGFENSVEIFVKNQIFYQKWKCLSKIQYFNVFGFENSVKNRNFYQKWKFLSKIEFLQKLRLF